MQRASAISDAPGAIARVFGWIKARTGFGGNPGGFSADGIGRLADDIGVSQIDLRQVARHPADNSELTQRMLRAQGLDMAALERSDPGVQRDIEATCTRCNQTRRCRQDLAGGNAGAQCRDYCPNAGTFAELTEATACFTPRRSA